jgi:hypothetical protein
MWKALRAAGGVNDEKIGGNFNVAGSAGFCGFGLVKMRHNWPKLFQELGQHASTQVYQNQSHFDKPG